MLSCVSILGVGGIALAAIGVHSTYQLRRILTPAEIEEKFKKVRENWNESYDKEKKRLNIQLTKSSEKLSDLEFNYNKRNNEIIEIESKFKSV